MDKYCDSSATVYPESHNTSGTRSCGQILNFIEKKCNFLLQYYTWTEKYHLDSVEVHRSVGTLVQVWYFRVWML